LVQKNMVLMGLLVILLLIGLTLACANSPTAAPAQATATELVEPSAPETQEAVPTATPTHTPIPSILLTPTPLDNPCAGLNGEIEVKVLVGPADAVGLEPHAVGSVPFSNTNDKPPYLVQGAGSINYAETLVEQWGTYDVSMEMQLTVAGECSSAGEKAELQLALEMSGNQLVVVTSQGFSGEYPWSGTHHFDLAFPLEEGATIDGEGYSFVLHLNSE
jgi:hypothetical protein